MIVGLLIRELAITIIDGAWQTRRSSNCEIDTSLAVWACFIPIEGVAYIAKLSNSPGDGAGISGRGVKILEAGQSDLRTVYVLEDHLGIRKLVFSRKHPLPSTAQSGLWWRTVSLGPKLYGKSDVSNHHCTSDLT